MTTRIEPLQPAAPKTMVASALAASHAPLLLALAVVAIVFLRQLVSGANSLTFDNDAILRMVQVRDLLGGQGWFDLHQYRMGPDGGFVMHWSRLIDAPIAGLILLSNGLGLPTSQAERLAAMLWPSVGAVVALWASMMIARRLGGIPAMAATALLATIGYFSLGLYANGAIDHHGAQVALAIALVALMTSVRPSAAHGVLAGLCAALMAGIGIETNLHVAVAAIAVSVLWLLDPDARRSFTIGFGLAVSGALLAILFGTQAHGALTTVTCDAFSIAHAVPGAVGGLGLAAVAWIGARGTVQRSLLLAIAGGVTVTSALPWSLECLRDPVADLDPVLRTMWLDGISEAMPFHRFIQNDAVTTFTFGMPTLIAFIAAIGFLARSSDVRQPVLIVAIFLGVTLAIALYQFRGITLGAYLAMPVLGAAVGRAWVAPSMKSGRAPALALMLLAMNTSWAMVGSSVDSWRRGQAGEAEYKMRTIGAAAEKLACTDSEFFETLAQLPPMSLFNTANHGAGILFHTPHRVMAGPYHRNVAGLKASILGFTSDAQAARTIIRDSGATHVLWCPDAADAMNFADIPGLAADLTAGRIPVWLAPVMTDPDGHYALYEVR
jgi:hypothetical protein